jgi:hypothetical protein
VNKVKIGLVLIGVGIGIVAGAGSMYMVYTKQLNQIDTDRDAAIRNTFEVDAAYLKAEYDEREVALKAYYEEREAEMINDHSEYRVQMRAKIALVNAEIDALKTPVEKKPRAKRVTKQKEEVLVNDSI